VRRNARALFGRVARELDRLMAAHGKPTTIVSDNGTPRGSVTWPGAKTQAGSGRREREGMDAGIGAKATVFDCIGGDGEGNCASR
jgi:hypothetical protein